MEKYVESAFVIEQNDPKHMRSISSASCLKSGIYIHVESIEYAWHTIKEDFCPRGRSLKPERRSSVGETAGNWRQLDVAASLKLEIALASTFSRIKSEN